MTSDAFSSLRLVPDDRALLRQQRLRSWLLSSAPDPLPDSSGIIQSISACPDVRPEDIEPVVGDLVQDGLLFRVQIGPTPHLTRSPGRGAITSFDEDRHRLEVRLDIESERQLLFHLALVLELIGSLLIVRHWILSSNLLSHLLN